MTKGHENQPIMNTTNTTNSSTMNTTNDDNTVDSNVYETNESLNMYLGMHYPYVSVHAEDDEKESPTTITTPSIIPHDNAPNHALQFPQRVANLLTRLVDQHSSSSGDERESSRNALDMGCAVGGSSFALAQNFDNVDAFDYSHSFIDAAKRIQKEGEEMKFRIPLEAELYEEVRIDKSDSLFTSSSKNTNNTNINFFQGDATQIDRLVEENKLRSNNNNKNSCYDAILMSNLLCRLPNPTKCLRSLPHLLEDGGIVLLVTPYSWSEEYTRKEHWLGGYYDPVVRSEKLWSRDKLERIMTHDNGMQLIHTEEIPCLIREHQRKYQYIIGQATAWRNK